MAVGDIVTRLARLTNTQVREVFTPAAGDSYLLLSVVGGTSTGTSNPTVTLRSVMTPNNEMWITFATLTMDLPSRDLLNKRIIVGGVDMPAGDVAALNVRAATANQNVYFALIQVGGS